MAFSFLISKTTIPISNILCTSFIPKTLDSNILLASLQAELLLTQKEYLFDVLIYVGCLGASDIGVLDVPMEQ